MPKRWAKNRLRRSEWLPMPPTRTWRKLAWDQLRTVFDPEIPVNVVELGLVYDLSLEQTESGERKVYVKLTLTAPGCGMGDILVDDARTKLEMIPTSPRRTWIWCSIHRGAIR
jgi:metal-sulfur cluster biosynthetic enzyme